MAQIGKHIYYRKDGRFEARYPKGKDSAGKTKYGAVYSATLEGVKEKLSSMTEFLPGKIADHPTVADTLTAYLDTASLTLKSSTVAVYRGYIKNHIKPFFKEISIAELTPQILQDFIRAENNNGLSSIVVQSVFSFLKPDFVFLLCAITSSYQSNRVMRLITSRLPSKSGLKRRLSRQGYQNIWRSLYVCTAGFESARFAD